MLIDSTAEQRREKRDRVKRDREERGIRDDELDLIAYATSRCCHSQVALLKKERQRRCRGCGTEWQPERDASLLGGQRMRVQP